MILGTGNILATKKVVKKSVENALILLLVSIGIDCSRFAGSANSATGYVTVLHSLKKTGNDVGYFAQNYVTRASGLLKPPRGYSDICAVMVSGHEGNSDALATVERLLTGDSASVYEPAIIGHIAWCIGNPPAGTFEPSKGSQRRIR